MTTTQLIPRLLDFLDQRLTHLRADTEQSPVHSEACDRVLVGPGGDCDCTAQADRLAEVDTLVEIYRQTQQLLAEIRRDDTDWADDAWANGHIVATLTALAAPWAAHPDYPAEEE